MFSKRTTITVLLRVPEITTADGCLSNSSFQHFNQHTDTLGDVSRELRVCRQSTGVFRVNFNSHGGFYKGDSVSGIFSARTANTYCNMGRVSCGDALCGGGQNVYIDVYCYDQAGSPINTAFNMSIIYH
jgi:hypothetical protein